MLPASFPMTVGRTTNQTFPQFSPLVSFFSPPSSSVLKRRWPYLSTLGPHWGSPDLCYFLSLFPPQLGHRWGGLCCSVPWPLEIQGFSPFFYFGGWCFLLQWPLLKGVGCLRSKIFSSFSSFHVFEVISHVCIWLFLYQYFVLSWILLKYKFFMQEPRWVSSKKSSQNYF